MKHQVIISILFALSLTTSAQFKLSQLKSEAWLPEAYVKSDIKNDTAAYKNLIPVEGIESPFRLGNIKIYGCEPISIKTKMVMHKGIEKYALIGITDNYNPKDTANAFCLQISKAGLYISAVEDKMLLEIVEKGKRQEILFVSQKEGYKFKTIESAKQYLISGEK